VFVLHRSLERLLGDVGLAGEGGAVSVPVGSSGRGSSKKTSLFAGMENT
jgi:hypothetical protein